jgi:Concanavalin A-like lectin/glucanases superfamily
MDFRNWFGGGASRGQRRKRRLWRRLMLEELEPRQLLSVNVTTYHNDLTRQGLNSAETALTPVDVNSSSFGKLFTYNVASAVSGGGQIYAEPLYASNLAIPGQGTHNVVFVATENNDVYAFDADSNAGPNGGLLWTRNVGTAAVTPPPNNVFGGRYGPYSDIKPQVGITSTPVIDLATNTMYIDSFRTDGVGLYSHHIYALDITTGLDKTASVTVAATVQGNGAGGNGTTITFDAKQQLQRPALTLLNGVVYVAYAGYADTDPYTGWVLGFDAATLQLTKVLNTTPNDGSDAHEGEGGIWQSGNGLSSDGTHLYVMTGNGDFQTNIGDYGDSFLEITPDNSTQPTNLNGHGLSITDSFTPFNEQSLSDADTDLGSGGTMFLPDQPGPYPHLLIGSGKQGVIYVINRDGMGGFTAGTDNVVQKVNLSHGTWSSPAYFNNTIYEHASGDVLKAFSLVNGVLSSAPVAQGGTAYGFPGATPSVSSNGDANGIVWDVEYASTSGTLTHAILRAYNAVPNGTTLAELYNSSQNVARDQLNAPVKFVTPMIANGKVYVGTTGGLAVFGLLSPPSAAPPVPTNLMASAPAALQIKLTWTDTATTEQWFKIERSTDGVNYLPVGVASANATSFVDTTVVAGTTYSYRVRAANNAGDSANAGPASATAISVSTPLYLYHFDEGINTSAFDSVGGNTGTLIGSSAPTWVAGRLGSGALSFSGNGQFNVATQSAVQTNSNLATTLGATSTLDVWVKTTATGSNTHYQAPAITGVDTAGNGADINWGTLNATGRIGIFVGDAGGVYSTNPINDGTWHNVAMTRDSATGIVQLYVDGVLNGTGAFDLGSKASQFFLIGALANYSGTTLTGANSFNGQLDEVRIYNRVLTPTEISEIGQVPAAPTGLTATPIPDSSSMVQLSWTNVSGFAQSVEVQRKTGAGGTYQQIALLNGSATGYTDINLDAGTQYFYQVRAIDLAGNSGFSNEANATPPRPTIVSRFTFYNKSFWDGQNGSSNIADNLAIATDKQALLPGQTASFQNYTSYSNGMNGIIVDVKDFEGVISEDDFTLLVGNSPNVNTWTAAPDPEFVAMYPGFGVGGTTRIELLWDNNAIENEWVQVTLKADAVTKLAAPDVFYFGNAIGESGNSAGSAVVDDADELAARTHGTGLLTAAITNPYDYNRDKHVDTADQLIARSQAGGPALQLFTAPAAGGGAAALSEVVDTSTAAPLLAGVSPAKLSSGRAGAVDSALVSIFAAPDAMAQSKSPLVASAPANQRTKTLIDEALLTALSTTSNSSLPTPRNHMDRNRDAASGNSSDATALPCDVDNNATDEALATDLYANKVRGWRSQLRGNEA